MPTRKECIELRNQELREAAARRAQVMTASDFYEYGWRKREGEKRRAEMRCRQTINFWILWYLTRRSHEQY